MNFKKLYTFSILCYLVTFSGCTKNELENPPNDSEAAIFLYMAADNDLDFYAVSNINQLESAFYETGILGSVYVYLDRLEGRSPSHPLLLKITPDNTSKINSKIIKVYPEQNSCSEDVFEGVLNDVKSHCQSNGEYIRGLILWSHGSAWLPNSNLLDSNRSEDVELKQSNTQKSTRSFGVDFTSDNSEMDIVKLAEKLKPYQFDFLIFDACFMSSIEVVYELQDSFDYIIASPTEILANGFPYKTITSLLFANNISYTDICSAFVAAYEEKTGILRSASVSLIKTSELKQFASLFKQMVLNYNSEINLSSILQYEKSRNYWIFDLGEFVTATNNPTLKEQLNQVVRTYKHTEYFYNIIPLNRGIGISVYIPNNISEYDKIKTYYKQLHWTNESGIHNLFAFDNGVIQFLQ